MSGKRQRTEDDPAQSKRFIDSAREAEADESEEGADRSFKKITRQHPSTSKKSQRDQE